MLVTGGAGGIGRASGAWFSSRGAAVVLADAADRVHGTARDVGAARGVVVDVTHETQVADMVHDVVAELGSLDVVVQAAGCTGKGPVASMEAAAWREVVDVNLTGAFLVAKAAIPALRRSEGGGRMVHCSSVNAHTGGNELSGAAYAAAKAGLEALTRHLAVHLAPHVQVNAVAPGPVATGMLARLSEAEIDALAAGIPAGRVAQAEEVAALIGFLCSPEAAYITGTVVHQNGGRWTG